MPIEYRCTVAGFRMLTPTVFEVSFNTDQPFRFEPGQFLSVVIPGAGPSGRDLRRAYSIASAPETKPVELCVKLVEEGPGTRYLYKLRTGDQFRAFAPYGDFVYEPKPGRHAVFIATGTGLAPFRSMAFSEIFRKTPPASTTCLFGVREVSELLYLDDFSKIPGLKFVPMISRNSEAIPWSGVVGRVTDYLRGWGDEFPWLDTEFYICGNGAMIEETKALLVARGVAKDSIHQEIYYRPPKKASPAGH